MVLARGRMRQMDIPIPTPIRHLPELHPSSGDYPTHVIDLLTKMTRIFQSTAASTLIHCGVAASLRLICHTDSNP